MQLSLPYIDAKMNCHRKSLHVLEQPESPPFTRNRLLTQVWLGKITNRHYACRTTQRRHLTAQKLAEILVVCNISSCVERFPILLLLRIWAICKINFRQAQNSEVSVQVQLKGAQTSWDPIAKRSYGSTFFQFCLQSWMNQKWSTSLCHIHYGHAAPAGS